MIVPENIKSIIYPKYSRPNKIKEAALFAVFSIIMWLAFVIWARFDATRREYYRNMELALKQCEIMIQNGEQDRLLQIITELLSADRHTGVEGFTQQAYLMSKRFREAVLPDSVEMREVSNTVLLAGLLIWGAFSVAWVALHLIRVRPDWQLNFQIASIGVSFFFLFSAFAGRSTDMGYRTNGIRFDLGNLRDALALPVFPQKMLEQLHNPCVRGPYQYLPNRFETNQ